MKASLLVILLFLIQIYVRAQTDTLQLTDSFGTSLYQRVEAINAPFEDDIESIKKSNSWQKLNDNFKPKNNHAVWMKFYIENSTQNQQRYFLRFPYNELIEIYVFRNNQLALHQQNGDFIASNKLDKLGQIAVNQIEINSQTTDEIYIKAANYQPILSKLRLLPQKPVHIKFSLSGEAKFNKWLNQYYAHNLEELQVRTTFQGGLGVILLIIFLIYLSNKSERIYKYYFFYVLCAFSFTIIKSRSFTYLGSFVGLFPNFKAHGGESIMWIGFAVYLYFTIELLNLKQIKPKFHQFLIKIIKFSIFYGIIIFLWMMLTNDSGLQSILYIYTRIPLLISYIFILIFIGLKVKSTMTKYVLWSNFLLIFFSTIAWLKGGPLNDMVWYGILNHLFTLPFAILLEIIVFALAVAQKIGEDRRLKNDFEKKAIEIEMTALRSQMNPHFIFNSLNTISYFVVSEQKNKAKEYLKKFSKLLRTILNFSQQDTVTLQEEIDALKNYLEIEATRFDDSFKYEFLIEESIELEAIKIPPMILQPFVENAIIHGLRNSQKESKLLSIKILDEENLVKIIIKDNGIGRKESEKFKSANPNKSFGIHITQQRVELYNHTSTNKITIETHDLLDESGTEVILRISV